MIAVLSAEISTNEYITGGFVMDWATLIVGILSFAGILLTIWFNFKHDKKLKKLEHESFNDEFSRELITNSRNEWLKNLKEDISAFISCLMNHHDIAWGGKAEERQAASQLLNKIKFSLNPIDKIDEEFFKLIQLAYDDFVTLSYDTTPSPEMVNHLDQAIYEIQQYASCMFKTEWERIKHHAKKGENENFDYAGTFHTLYNNVTQYELL